MSQVRIKYNNALPFFSVGPTPLVSIENQNQYTNSEIVSVDTVTLNGRVKRTDGCNGGFANVKQLADVLTQNFSRSFKKLVIEESMDEVDDAIFYTIYSWDYCLVRSISFDEDTWYDWIPYTIVIDCYKDGYMTSNGITDPTREVTVENLPDNTINLSITCSCKGLNNDTQGFQNARQFVYDNSSYLASDLSDTHWSHSSIHSATPYLVSEVETHNRLTGTVSVTRSYVIQDSRLGFTRGVLKYKREISTNDVGETTVTINGEHQGNFRDNTTLLAIEDDIKGTDWYSIAKNEIGDYDISIDPDYELNKLIWNKEATRATKYLWSTYEPTTQTFVKNPDSFVDSLDMSGFVNGCSESGYEGQKLGVMISPRHFLFTWHFKAPIGTSVYFVAPDGSVITRTISNHIEVSSPSDVGVGVLNADLPSNIKYYPILPYNYSKYINLIGKHCLLRDQITGSVSFTGSISGTTLTYASRFSPLDLLEPGMGIGAYGGFTIAPGTSIVGQLTGEEGKEGTYEVNISQTEAGNYYSSGLVIPKCTFRKITKNASGAIVENRINTAQSTEGKFEDFFEPSTNWDSGSVLFTILKGKLVLLGHMQTGSANGDPERYVDGGGGDGPSYHYYGAEINSAMATLGGGYSVEYFTVDDILYSSPVNFSLNRDFSKNAVQFSIEYSNKKFNDVYVVDETKVITDNETSNKCIEVALTIKSDLKCETARWNAIVNYYNNLDFVDYVQQKWEKYGNTERLNFNVKDNSYSENRFVGEISLGAKFCMSLGNDCGCLQDINYQYSFVPSQKEYKVSIPNRGQGCHFIEDLMVYKRASFSLQGSLVKPICCTYEKTVLELKNRANQISNSLFYGEQKILDSAEISKSNPAGEISFNFSWSAKKDPIIPDNLL